jgi:hypothetical protein
MSSILIPPGLLPPVEGQDFVFIENTEAALKIKILREDYKDITYVYKYVALIPPAPAIPKDEFDDVDAQYNMVEEEEETARLKFDYLVIDNPLQFATNHNPDFERLIGDILSYILTDATTNPSTKYTMFSVDAEGKIENLKPVKDSALRDKIVGVPEKKSGGLMAMVKKVKRFLFSES